MIDEELQRRAMEFLGVATALILNEAADLATRTPPETAEGRLDRLERLASAGRDVALLAESCAVLVRRGRTGRSAPDNPLD